MIPIASKTKIIQSFLKGEDIKKTAKKRLVKALDDKCREIVYLRDGNTCQRCQSKTNRLNWAHIFSRSHWSIRWLPLNSICLCAGCHQYFHREPTEFIAFVRGFIGCKSLEKLEIMKRNHFSRSLENLYLVKSNLERIKNGN
jgi:hypothetical protein